MFNYKIKSFKMEEAEKPKRVGTIKNQNYENKNTVSYWCYCHWVSIIFPTQTPKNVDL